MLSTNNVIDMQDYRMRKLFREHPVISIQQAARIKQSRFYNSYASSDKRTEVSEEWATEDTDNTPTKVNPDSRFGHLTSRATQYSTQLDDYSAKLDEMQARINKALELCNQ